MGSAGRWGPRWGAWAREWARTEERQLPTYDEAIRRTPVAAGDRVLELGCGSGVFLRAAADRGAHVAGLDASEALVALARARVPGADVRTGDMQSLPYADGAFDVVAAFNSLFYAADMTATLREARRVARPGGAVVIQVFGRPEACALTAVKPLTAAYFPPPEPGAPSVPVPPLWRPGVLEALARDAGLEPESAFDLSYAFAYRDDDELARGMLAAAGAGDAAGPERAGALRAAVLDALAEHRTPGGGYRLANEWHFMVARA